MIIHSVPNSSGSMAEDKSGLAWQIVPERIMKLISNPRGMAAMKKLDIAVLEEEPTGLGQPSLAILHSRG